VEPVVDWFVGGLEIISTEDMLARIDAFNARMEDWNMGSGGRPWRTRCM
jgi:hypothetical protein